MQILSIKKNRNSFRIKITHIFRIILAYDVSYILKQNTGKYNYIQLILEGKKPE